MVTAREEMPPPGKYNPKYDYYSKISEHEGKFGKLKEGLTDKEFDVMMKTMTNAEKGIICTGLVNVLKKEPGTHPKFQRKVGLLISRQRYAASVAAGSVANVS